MSAGLSLTEAPTSAIPVVQDADDLRRLLGQEWAVGPYLQSYYPPGRPAAEHGPFPAQWAGYPPPNVPDAERAAVNAVRAAQAEWVDPRTDAEGVGPCLLNALFKPVPEAEGVGVENLALSQLESLTSAEHLAALAGRTPRVHPRLWCRAGTLKWPATEFAPDTVHPGGPCMNCAGRDGMPIDLPAFPRNRDAPYQDAGYNQGWTPLAEWANRDGWDNFCQTQLAKFEKGTEGFRRFEDRGRAWAKGRDALTALACQYVNRLRDESLEEDRWTPPPGPIKPPPPPPKRNLSWH